MVCASYNVKILTLFHLSVVKIRQTFEPDGKASDKLSPRLVELEAPSMWLASK